MCRGHIIYRRGAIALYNTVHWQRNITISPSLFAQESSRNTVLNSTIPFKGSLYSRLSFANHCRPALRIRMTLNGKITRILRTFFGTSFSSRCQLRTSGMLKDRNIQYLLATSSGASEWAPRCLSSNRPSALPAIPNIANSTPSFFGRAKQNKRNAFS